MYIFVKGRLIKYYKWDVRDGETYELYKTNYVSFYNNKYFVGDSKSELKVKLLCDIEKKKEKDEYYKRY